MHRLQLSSSFTYISFTIKPFLESVGKPILAKKKGQFEIFGYKTKGKKIYLIKSGIGEIYASSATQLLISEYKVDLIMNFGVCGSLNSSVGLLDTVIVKGVVQYDFDLSQTVSSDFAECRGNRCFG